MLAFVGGWGEWGMAAWALCLGLVATREADPSKETKEGFDEILRESIMDGMRYIFGESAARVVFLHVGTLKSVEDFPEFSRKLLAVFKVGTDIVERNMTKELYRKVGLTYSDEVPFDFEARVNAAREAYQGNKEEAK
jgi:protein-disulfide isomerase-like protein with CxxC motif